MRIKLQDQVPYQDSLRWKIHDDYFQSRGADAFVEREVPSNITSNPAAAFQNARVLVEALRFQQLDPAAPVRILEVAGGLGIFAINFIRAFEVLCRQAEVDYSDRLEYWLTDFSLKTLQTLAKHPVYQSKIQQGRLHLYRLNALEPETVTNLAGKAHPLPECGFSAILANYHHCTLPVAILLHHQGAFIELQTELFGWLAGSPKKETSEAQRGALLQQ
ncbi:MAG: hypothetical protein ACAI44_04455, partial [Candidatus Sericytochromatia bacterium]